MTTKVLVVDDTVVFRRVVSDALSAIPGVEVVGTASNGKLALARLASVQPDLITLDVEMPEMNGIEMLQTMAANNSTAGVIMVSSNTIRGGRITVQALELGAFDFITKPEGRSAEENLTLLRGRLLPIVRAWERQREIRQILDRKPRDDQKAVQRSTPRTTSVVLDPPARSPRRSGSPIVLIGVSTGGPAALAEVIPAFPGTLAAPVFIVQHMPPLFTSALAERLNSISALGVKEGEDGEKAVAGRVYIAPGGRHMRIEQGQKGEIVVRITDDPPENNCRPSVDYLFRSAALHFPGRSVAAILTGMGNDGTLSLGMLKRSGCATIAQDEATCVVFGMPREAILAGVVDTIVPLKRVAETVLRRLGEAGA